MPHWAVMGATDQHLPDVTAGMHVFVCLVSCEQTFVTWCYFLCGCRTPMWDPAGKVTLRLRLSAPRSLPDWTRAQQMYPKVVSYGGMRQMGSRSRLRSPLLLLTEPMASLQLLLSSAQHLVMIAGEIRTSPHRYTCDIHASGVNAWHCTTHVTFMAVG